MNITRFISAVVLAAVAAEPLSAAIVEVVADPSQPSVSTVACVLFLPLLAITMMVLRRLSGEHGSHGFEETFAMALLVGSVPMGLLMAAIVTLVVMPLGLVTDSIYLWMVGDILVMALLAGIARGIHTQEFATRKKRWEGWAFQTNDRGEYESRLRFVSSGAWIAGGIGAAMKEGWAREDLSYLVASTTTARYATSGDDNDDDWQACSGASANIDGSPMVGGIDINGNVYEVSSSDSWTSSSTDDWASSSSSIFDDGPSCNINGAPMCGGIDINGDTYGSTMNADSFTSSSDDYSSFASDSFSSSDPFSSGSSGMD